MKTTIKKYKIFILMIVVYVVVFFLNQPLFETSSTKAYNSMIEMASILPPIFILLGLLDVWVKRETMVKMMGEGSGFKGIFLAFLIGTAAAGPLYAGFPVALMLLRKGSSYKNVLIMIGAWSTTKIPLLMFEAASMGIQFTVIRFILNIFGILFIAWVTEKALGKNELDTIRKHALEVESK